MEEEKEVVQEDWGIMRDEKTGQEEEEEEAKIEELPPRHSSILPLWWEHISPVL